MIAQPKNSSKWLYTYIIIGVAALVTGIANLYYEQYITVIAMAFVLLAQIINIVKWRKMKR